MVGEYWDKDCSRGHVIRYACAHGYYRCMRCGKIFRDVR